MLKPVVCRSRSNQVSGWLIAVGLLVLNIVVMDPLHLYSTWDDAPKTEAWYVELPFYAFFAALALGSFAVFARPRVEVNGDEAVLRNVVRDVYIPLGAVQCAASGKNLVVTAAGRNHHAAGAESWNIPMFGSASKDAARLVRSAARPEAPSGPVTVRWRRPERVELLLAAAWILYPVAAFAADFSGLQPS